MAKISELPVVAAPNGAETVVVLDGGETRRATIGGLVEGAVETAAASSYRAVATYGEREAIPLSRRKPGLAVRVLEAGPDGGRVFLWSPELFAPGGWTGLLTQEESTRLDLMHGGLAQDKIYGLTPTLAAMKAETAKVAQVAISGVRAEAQAGTAIVTWARSGGQPDAQSVAWGGWTLPIRAGAQRFEARDWSRIDRLFVVGNSLSDTTGANDQWSQLLAADLNVPLVSTARGSSDARQVYKAGARPINLTLAGPLPANGSVAITQINGAAPGWDNPASFLNSYGGDATPAAMEGWAIDGPVSRRVTVSIARSDSFAYQLSQAGGNAVAFSGAVLFVPDAAREPERSLTCIWIGNNYFFSGVANSYGDHTNPTMWQDMDALVRTADGGRIFILPVLPSTLWTERGLGSPYAAYLSANARTKALYPRYWLVDAQARDIIAYLQAVGSDGSEGDSADVLAGFIPRSCRTDNLHLNGKGRALVRDFVKAALPLQALPPAIVEGTAVTVSATRGGVSDSVIAVTAAGRQPTAEQIADTAGKVIMTAAERTEVARMAAVTTADRPRYIRRAQLVSGDIDAVGRVTDATLMTGASYSRSLAVQIGNGLNYGPRGLSLGTVEGVLPLGAASYDTRRPVYVKRRQLLSGDVSPSGRVIEARYADGGALTATGTVELPRRPLYARRQYASAVEIDRRGRIVAATLANGRAFPNFAGSDQIVVLGDSLAAGFTNPIGLATNRPVVGMGIGSQQPTQIVNRVIGVTMRAADRRIVAGPNAITHLNGTAIAGASKAAPHMFLSRIGSMGVRFTSVGRWGGVRGTVTVVPSLTGGNDTYSFVADADQLLPVAIPDDTPFVPDHPKSATHVVSLGRNGSWTDGVAKTQMDRLTRFLGHDRILWLAVPNGDLPGEHAGQAQYAEIAALNATFFADRAGYEYLDVPRFLKGQGLALAGLVPTAQDEIDATRDVVSTQLRGDTLHYNATGSRIAAQHLIAPHIAQRKW